MSGGLITWGRANYGQLGHGRKQRADLPTPTTVSQLQGRPLQGVSCGHFHSAAVVAASPAQVHTWGRGALGLLGHGDEEDCYVPRPVKALAGIAIRQVACGAYHTVAVAESYRLFSWGWRLEQARGGAIVESYSTLPEQVHALDGLEVRAASCGHYATAACTSDGLLFTWGKGERGQLGHGHPHDVVYPQRVAGGALASDPFVWDAKLGKHFLVVLLASGDLCSCGAADGGVLGRGASGGMLMLGGGSPATLASSAASSATAYALSDEHTLRPIPALQGARVGFLACGEGHVAVITGSGEVYTWGMASYGRLGHSGVDDVATPTPVGQLHGKRFVEVACGAHCTLALTDGGQVFTWGGHSAQPPPPTRVRLGGAACTLGCGGGHCAVGIGEYPCTVPSDLALARQVGFEPPVTRASIPPMVADALGPLSAVVEARVPPDADPASVLRELHELRGLLAHEESRRDAANAELMELQQQLQQLLVDEEMLRERRGGEEPPPPPSHLGKGLALVDASTYKSMLPDERLEVSLFGFKLAVATTPANTRTA